MALKQSVSDWLVPKLHKISALRSGAKKLLRGYTIQQPFHGGVICLDAVDHSWAWTGSRRYETFDRELQDKLLSLSQNYDLLIDLGCNIGAITLSVLLRNPKIKAVCVDPNARAIALLRSSVSQNQIADRVNIIEAAVSDTDGVLTFDESGSVTGHVSESGRKVDSIGFAKLINEASGDKKCLVKIDIEGFETKLLKQLAELKYLQNLCLVLELHPLHFNEIGNPDECLNLLFGSGAIVEDIKGQRVNRVESENIAQVIARWSDEV